MQKLIITLVFIFSGVVAFSQSCSQKLVQAERDYEAGRLAGIPNSLSACLNDKDGLTKEEWIRAYRLFTLVHIFTDNEPAAEEALVNLLGADPEHELLESTDPAELFYLYEQFQVKPIFRIGLRLGLNSSFPSVLESFSTSNQLENRKFYNGKEENSEFTDLNGRVLALGFWGELTFEKYLGSNIEIVGGLQGRISS